MLGHEGLVPSKRAEKSLQVPMRPAIRPAGLATLRRCPRSPLQLLAPALPEVKDKPRRLRGRWFLLMRSDDMSRLTV